MIQRTLKLFCQARGDLFLSKFPTFFFSFFQSFAKPQPLTLFAQNVSLKIYINIYIILDIGVDGPETDFKIR